MILWHQTQSDAGVQCSSSAFLPLYSSVCLMMCASDYPCTSSNLALNLPLILCFKSLILISRNNEQCTVRTQANFSIVKSRPGLYISVYHDNRTRFSRHKIRKNLRIALFQGISYIIARLCSHCYTIFTLLQFLFRFTRPRNLFSTTTPKPTVDDDDTENRWGGNFFGTVGIISN